MTEDERFMQTALELAARGRGLTAPNPMVGALVVRNGRIVGRGFHAAAGKAHAEIVAIDDAGPYTEGAALYVTLEPCHHFGRTPPCTQKILAAGIRKVVCAMPDPNPDVAGGGMAYLAGCGIEVVEGICRISAEKLNEVFIKYVTTKEPFVVVKCAATLDGQLATRTGDAKWITGDASRRSVHWLRHAVDAIMVGVDTVKRDNPRLTTRLKETTGKDPLRLILDTHLSIPETATVLNPPSSSAAIIVTGPLPHDAAVQQKKNRLEKRGVFTMEAPLQTGWIDLAALMPLLGRREITSLLIEGGGRVIASAFAADIVDKAVFYFAPKILGGNDGVAVCRGRGPSLMKDSIRLKDIAVHRYGDDVAIEGRVKRRLQNRD